MKRKECLRYVFGLILLAFICLSIFEIEHPLSFDASCTLPWTIDYFYGDSVDFLPKAQVDITIDDIVVAVLTGDKYKESRVRQLRETWLPLFPHFLIFADTNGPEPFIRACCPHNIYGGKYGNIGTTQYKWKYIPTQLFREFPSKQYFFMVDDDTYVFPELILNFIHNVSAGPRPQDLTVVVPASASFVRPLSDHHCDLIEQALLQKFPECQTYFLIPGGLMLFTHGMMRELAKQDRVMACQDDLAVMDAKGAYPFGGRYEVNEEGDIARYNQDHLFSWCVQGRLGGFVQKTDMFWFFGGNIPRGFLRNMVRKTFGYINNTYTDANGTEHYNCFMDDFRKRNIGAIHQLKKKAVIPWVHKHCGFAEYYRTNPAYSYTWEQEYDIEQFFNTTLTPEQMKKEEKQRKKDEKRRRKEQEQREKEEREHAKKQPVDEETIAKQKERVQRVIGNVHSQRPEGFQQEKLAEISRKAEVLMLLFHVAQSGRKFKREEILQNIQIAEDDFTLIWEKLLVLKMEDSHFDQWFLMSYTQPDAIKKLEFMNRAWLRISPLLKAPNDLITWLDSMFPTLISRSPL